MKGPAIWEPRCCFFYTAAPVGGETRHIHPADGGLLRDTGGSGLSADSSVLDKGDRHLGGAHRLAAGGYNRGAVFLSEQREGFYNGRAARTTQ